MLVINAIFVFMLTEAVTMLSILAMPTSEDLGVRLLTKSINKNSGLFHGDTAVSGLARPGAESEQARASTCYA